MHHRSGSWVKGHYRNGTWITGHNRKSTYVSNYAGTAYSGDTFSYTANLDHEYTFLKKYFRLESTPFKKDTKYANIDNKIKKIIFPHFLHLIAKKVENKNDYDFISYLEKYIIDNIESELLEIKNIKNFYTKLNDILQIVYILILCEMDNYYTITYISAKKSNVATDTGENGKKIIKNIIIKNKAILSQYYNQEDWEYLRNKFFDQEVKNKIYNPGINFRLLFKKTCEENLIKGEIIILSKEEIVEVMINIIQENRVILSKYYNQDDWEYQRNKFFNQEVKNKIYSPKLALHILFKKVCDDNLH